MARVVTVLLLLGVIVYALIDCVQSPPRRVRAMPKPLWLITILIVPVLGAVAWLLVGRPASTSSGRVRRNDGRPVAPDDDPDFLRDLDRRPPPGPADPGLDRPDDEEPKRPRQ